MRTDMLHQLEGVVRRAGDIVREAHDIERATMEKHGAADLVTKYDVAVQGFLQRELLALLPEADFLGEEGDHTALTRPWTFIVDPIDGTTNFVRRLHYSDISVALAQDGQTQYAVVYDPFADELFSAQKDGGAFCNGLPIRVSERDMAHAVFLCGSTIYDRSLTEQNFSLIRQLYEKGLDFRRFGAAALDLCQVAAGRVEVFGECCLSPWVYAAGSLIITEAVGIVTDFTDTAPDVHAALVGVCQQRQVPRRPQGTGTVTTKEGRPAGPSLLLFPVEALTETCPAPAPPPASSSPWGFRGASRRG